MAWVSVKVSIWWPIRDWCMRQLSRDCLRHPLLITVVGSGILGWGISCRTTGWQIHLAEQSRQWDEHKRRADFIARLSQNSDRTLDALASYRRISIYLEDNAKPPEKDEQRKKYVGFIEYEDALKLSLTLYSYYLQTQTLESIYAEVALVYDERDAGIIQSADCLIVRAKKMKVAKSEADLDKQKEEFQQASDDLIKKMKAHQQNPR